MIGPDKKTPPLLIALAWIIVLVPLGWGIVQSVVKSMPLFQTTGASAGNPDRDTHVLK
jgi:hypothetical protein